MGDLANKIPYLSKLDPNKRFLMDYVFAYTTPRPRTFADLGGVWGVDGAYSLYAMDHHGCVQGHLVDTHPNPRVLDHVAQVPGLTLIQGNFGDPAVIAQVPSVDCIFLFDVLLHQVYPHWNDVLAAYAAKTQLFVVYNQQWTGSPITVRLLDLGRDAYFANTPHEPEHPTYQALYAKMYEEHPDHPGRMWRDVHHVWQWGITDSDLLAITESLGFALTQYTNFGRFGQLPNIENHAFVFRRR
jgi:hypothetical protein